MTIAGRHGGHPAAHGHGRGPEANSRQQRARAPEQARGRGQHIQRRACGGDRTGGAGDASPEEPTVHARVDTGHREGRGHGTGECTAIGHRRPGRPAIRRALPLIAGRAGGADREDRVVAGEHVLPRGHGGDIGHPVDRQAGRLAGDRTAGDAGDHHIVAAHIAGGNIGDVEHGVSGPVDVATVGQRHPTLAPLIGERRGAVRLDEECRGRAQVGRDGRRVGGNRRGRRGSAEPGEGQRRPIIGADRIIVDVDTAVVAEENPRAGTKTTRDAQQAEGGIDGAVSVETDRVGRRGAGEVAHQDEPAVFLEDHLPDRAVDGGRRGERTVNRAAGRHQHRAINRRAVVARE